MDVKEKISGLPGLAKMGIYAGLGVMGLIVLSTGVGAIASLLNPAPQTGKPAPLPDGVVAPPAVETPSAEVTPSAEIDQKRVELWQNLQNSNAQFQSVVSDFETRMRVARGQRWYQHAITECQRMGPQECPNPYLWLVYQQQQRVFALRQELIAGKVGTDTASADNVRKKLEDIQDLAAALTMTEGTPPVPAIATSDLADKAVEVYGRAAAYEALRQQDANRALENRERQGGGVVAQ